ncbi:MAG: hypothetical protein B5766_05715 [Candidatus Lumbricidophila eiseniae]|uniref:SURF1-like protein n=1 Tax=Candidatus Lumbricidiphila eiseniae TaxID=1969409 RepID=A0A2A6FSZ5_9MICO|nr:MAG: hypothetical protein B5766_05715 [Candidatus Lumbricidophila eiseniae]
MTRSRARKLNPCRCRNTMPEQNRLVTGQNGPVIGRNRPVIGKNEPVTGKNEPVTGQSTPALFDARTPGGAVTSPHEVPSPAATRGSGQWRFLISRRWAGYLSLTIVFAVVCSLLGLWQFARRAEAQAEIARINANYDSPAVPVSEVLPTLTSFAAVDRWKVVSLSGEYLTAEQVVIRNRPLGGNNGFEVVTPFRLDDNSVFMINRGWIAPNSKGRPGAVTPPPSGRIEVTARLKGTEGRIAGRTSVGAELATIDLAELAQRVAAAGGGTSSYTGAYGLLIPQPNGASGNTTPSVVSSGASGLGAGGDAPSSGATPTVPQAAPRPALDEGPHLSYALQWFVFATMGFVGLGWAANRERTTELELRDTHNNSRDAAAAVRVHGGTVFSANGAPTPSGTPIGNFPEELTSVGVRAPSGAPRYPRPITRHRAKKVNVDSEYEDSVLDSATHTR